MDESMDGWMDGRTDRWTDRWINTPDPQGTPNSGKVSDK